MNNLIGIGVFLLITCVSAFGSSSTELDKTIYLISDREHFTEESVELNRKLLTKAAERKIIFASEGLERDVLAEKEFKEHLRSAIRGITQGYVFGIEDPFFNIFKELLCLNNILRTIYKRFDTIDETSKNVISGKKNDILCPLVTKSNQKLLIKFWNNETLNDNPIFKFLKDNKQKLISLTFHLQTEKFSPEIKKWKRSTWEKFTRETALLFLDDIKTIIPLEKLDALDFLMSCFNDFKLNSECDGSDISLGHEQKFQKSLHLTLRNDFLVKNLEEIYYITQKNKVPLVSVLGDAHMEGVTQALLEKGFTILGEKELFELLNNLNKIDL